LNNSLRFLRSTLRTLGFVLAMFSSPWAQGSLDGAGSIMILPLIAQTGSYASEVTVRNPYNFTLQVLVFYTGGTVTTGAGLNFCAPLNIAPFSTVQFSVGSQCALPAGGQFGLVTLVENAAVPSPFQAFSRTQTPGGNGFSVPAFPAGALEAPYWGHYAVGLKRQTAAPVYQTNCFVASTDDPTPYQIRLLNASGNQIGNTISGSLQPYQMVRYLDIFSAVGLFSGDYSNVTAEFAAGMSPTAALISFCTVQESTFFGADFRMAQPSETRDGTRQREVDSAVFNLNAYTAMNRHDIVFRHPDYVRCFITSPSAAVLELRITSPSGAVVAGGTNVSDSGTFYTGTRALYQGFSDSWAVDIASKPAYFGPFPVSYTFSCFSGNGAAANSITRILNADF